MAEEKKLTEQESLELIQSMISKAKNSYYETGVGPLLWGSLVSFCALVTFAQLQFHFSLPFDIWLLTFIAVVPQVIISIKERKNRKAVKHEDSVLSIVWLSFGISLFLLVHINIGVYTALNPILEAYAPYNKIPGTAFDYSSYSTSMFMILYGIPSVITGRITNLKPMLYGGILCWVCSIIGVYTAIKTDVLLIALCAVFAWLIPGIIIRRRFVAKKKEMNV